MYALMCQFFLSLYCYLFILHFGLWNLTASQISRLAKSNKRKVKAKKCLLLFKFSCQMSELIIFPKCNILSFLLFFFFFSIFGFNQKVGLLFYFESFQKDSPAFPFFFGSFLGQFSVFLVKPLTMTTNLFCSIRRHQAKITKIE